MYRVDIFVSYLKNHNLSFITYLCGYKMAKTRGQHFGSPVLFDSYLSLQTLLAVPELPLFFKSRFYIFSLFNELCCLFFLY
jgi:hypothetical protein